MPNSPTVTSSRRMLAALLVGPTRLEVREVPQPACPDDGLRLRVAACGICGSDIRAFRGHKAISGVHRLGDEVLAGHVVGHEIAGVVDAVGPEVTGFRAGDRVTVAPSLTCGTCDACRRGESVVCRSYGALGWSIPGGFAEYVAVPGRLLTDGSVNRIPDPLPAWRASLTEPLACAVHAQTALQVGRGDVVLVSGGGPMGSLNVLLARQRGAALVAMADPNECRRDFARSLGAVLTVDPKAPEAAAALLDGTRGQGFSAVILAVSSIGPIRELFRLSPEGRYPLLAPGARVNVFSGLDPGDTAFSLDARAFFYQGLRLIASVNSAPSHNAEALRLIATGAVDVGPLVTARLPLSQAGEAIALAMSRPRVNQKVVLEPSPERSAGE
jgi:L-iditol 2-dehydrogenase